MRILKRYGRREKFAVLCGTQISEDNHPKFHYYFNVEQKLLPKVIPILFLSSKSQRLSRNFKSVFLLFCLHSVQYAQHLYGYLKEWRKNPQWSFSCCLALILPLIDMPGDISGLSEANVLNNQLDTGEMEMTTVADAVKDSGATDITLQTNEQDVVNVTVVQEDSCNNTRSQSDAMGMHNKGAVQDIGATDDTLKSSAAELLQRGISWRNSKACHRGIQTTLSTDRGLLKERRLSFSGSIMQRDIC